MRQSIIAYYKEANLLTKLYIKLRLWSCPFQAIEPYVPLSGKIMDLGCGLGLFSAWLHEKSAARIITAIDWNLDRIDCAKKSLGKKINFIANDITDISFDACEGVVLLDTLYLFSNENQEKLLLRFHQALRKKGVLLILEKDTRPWIKYLWCMIQEFFSTKLANSNHSRCLNLRNKQKMLELIEKAGFSVTTEYLGRGYFYPHILYICING